MRVYQLIEALEKLPQHYDVRIEHGVLSFTVDNVCVEHGAVLLCEECQLTEEE